MPDSAPTPPSATGSGTAQGIVATGEGVPRHRRSLTGRLVPWLLIALLLWWGWPWLKNSWKTLQLVTESPPLTLPVPVQGITPAQLHDTWGAARSGGRTHQGIDIFAPRGTPVLAATRGVVTRRGENRLGGRVVTVMGPGRQFHYYAHLEDWAPLEPGDWVEAGTLLGYAGTSGNAANTPPHLHYGIYTPTGAINPYPLLTASGP